MRVRKIRGPTEIKLVPRGACYVVGTSFYNHGSRWHNDGARTNTWKVNHRIIAMVATTVDIPSLLAHRSALQKASNHARIALAVPYESVREEGGTTIVPSGNKPAELSPHPYARRRFSVPNDKST